MEAIRLSLELKDNREAEAEVIVTVVGAIVVPIGRAAVPGVVVPTAAAIHAIRALDYRPISIFT
ncbi:MAG: hypothetical protein BWY70_01403 [Bacteroidetes bacterium ADurb.Bin408]|nr:MAG: hypothetical protein BWY70_01403 [Bacteroidetes bacterium ADurb.Bin408]